MYGDPSIIIPAVGVLVGFIGLVFGGYQYYSTSERKQRKRRLKETADHLNSLKQRLENGVKFTREPLSNEDARNGLNLLLESYISTYYFLDENPSISLRISMLGKDRDESVTDDTNLILDELKGGASVHFSGIVKPQVSLWETDLIGHDVGKSFPYIKYGYNDIEVLRNNYIDIIEEFSPDLLIRVENQMDESISSSIEHTKEVNFQIDPEEYDSFPELALDTYEKIWCYDGIETDLAEFEGLIEEIESVRRSLIESSYS